MLEAKPGLDAAKELVILGVNGFVGSNLARRAISRSYRVIGLDRFQSPATLVDQRNLSLIKFDIFSSAPPSPELVAGRTIVDCIGDSNPLDLEGISASGFEKLLYVRSKAIDGILAMKPAAYIFCSSGGAVYGETSQLGAKESDLPAPISKYGLLKSRLEEQIRGGRTPPTETSVLRISTLYGCRKRNLVTHGFIQNTVLAALKNNPIKIYGAGELRRDYLLIDDLSSTILSLIEENTFEEVLNIGSGVGYSLSEVVDVVESTLTKKIRIVQSPVPFGINRNALLDITRLKALLPTFSPTPLAKGVEMLAREIRSAQ